MLWTHCIRMILTVGYGCMNYSKNKNPWIQINMSSKKRNEKEISYIKLQQNDGQLFYFLPMNEDYFLLIVSL